LLRLGGGAFCAGKVLGEGIKRSSLNTGSTFGVSERPMNEKIGVTADGGGEVGVVGFGQAKVAETFGRVDGPFEGAKKTDLEGVAIGPTGKKLENFLDFAALGEVACFDAVREEEFPVFQ
jgi:hypothetical protein